VAALPSSVAREAQRVRLAGSILYPYWSAPVTVRVRAPLLGERSRQAAVVVDGVTGEIRIPPPALRVRSQAPSDVLAVGTHEYDRAEIDPTRVRYAVLAYAGRRLRSWLNVHVDVGKFEPVYKELLLFDVAFRGGGRARISLDTITGEYGLLPPTATDTLEEGSNACRCCASKS